MFGTEKWSSLWTFSRSDVIPTDNSLIHAEVTSPDTLTSSLIRIATLSKEDLNLLLDDKDAKSTKRATKSALKVFSSVFGGKESR